MAATQFSSNGSASHESPSSTQLPPRIVIIGAGFGGLQAARALRGSKAQVTIIDRSNHHLFQPLLYQVATAGLSPADIASPIRVVMRKVRNSEVLMGEVVDVDTAEKKVILETGVVVPYDYLVIATGATHSYFGKEHWAKFAPGLKSIADATAIRQKILLAFETAEIEQDAERKKALLTMIVVGGGPTGVEMAGSIAEMSRLALCNDFKHFDPTKTRIMLIEGSDRILGQFPEDLAMKAHEELVRLGVEVRTGQRVEEIDEEGVIVGGERIHAKTVIWAAGVKASPAGEWLGAEVDRAGRVVVNGDMSVKGHREIFVIGDTATALDEEGRAFPGVAPVAIQQGKYVGKVLLQRLLGDEITEPFHYFDKGSLATVGRAFAILQFRKFKLAGGLAWLAWIFIHIMYLVEFRNRVAVFLEWLWAYMTYQRGVRLIVGEEEPRPIYSNPARRTVPVK
jgi:NADH:ubiquinone reductase (H+-translocating)